MARKIAKSSAFDATCPNLDSYNMSFITFHHNYYIKRVNSRTDLTFNLKVQDILDKVLTFTTVPSKHKHHISFRLQSVICLNKELIFCLITEKV